jgi:hypothetical protein
MDSTVGAKLTSTPSAPYPPRSLVYFPYASPATACYIDPLVLPLLRLFTCHYVTAPEGNK